MSVDLRIGAIESKPALGVVIPNFAASIEAVDSRLDAKTRAQKSLVKFTGKTGERPKADYHAILAALPEERHRELFLELAVELAAAEGRSALAKDLGGKEVSRG